MRVGKVRETIRGQSAAGPSDWLGGTARSSGSSNVARGTRSGADRSIPSSAASAGSARAIRASRRPAIWSGSTPEGNASEPRSRHRPASRATSATDVVAVPRSIAKKARGLGVTTPSCYRPSARPACGGAARRSGAGVPGRFFVELFEPRDELLDAVVVGHDLAGVRRSPPKTPRSTGSKNSIAFAPSGRYGRLAWRK